MPLIHNQIEDFLYFGFIIINHKEKIKMRTKEYILTALMLAMGLILHGIMPPIVGGMKPDLLLIFLVLAIMLTPDVKNTIVAGVGAGLLSAFTTSFPGGQLPNIIDKIITAFAILFLIKLLSFIKSDIAKSVIIMGVATLVSGVAFLTSALLIVGLSAPFAVLFTTVVLPALVSNVVIGTFVCKAILVATKNKITAV